jgi:hypothetical protein
MHQCKGSLSVPYLDGAVEGGGCKEAWCAGWVGGEVSDGLIGKGGDLLFVGGMGAEGV